MNRAQLESMAAEKMAKEESFTRPSRQDLELMAAEKMGKEEVSVNPNREADLGFVNRSRYAIEPLESNRLALLVQEFGQENIMQDQKGNVYVNQGGQFRPVNKEGLSFADVTDFAGATPEMVGGLIAGAAAGLAGIPTTGGTASIPMAIAGGAGGAATGSVFRQGVSSLLGTPQVANMGERVAETGMSAALGGVFSGVGQGVKQAAPAIKKAGGEALEGVSKVFKRSKPAAQALEGSLSNNLDNSLNISMVPEFADSAIKNPGSEVLERSVVSNEMDNLTKLAARQNLPAPTYAQAAGGKAILAEDRILNTPLVGGKVRKQVDSQLDTVKENLERNVGKFLNEDSTGLEVGLATKGTAQGIVSATKRAAQELYTQVEEVGKDAMIGKKTFLNKFRDRAGEWGLLDVDPESKLGFKPAQYRADTGLTREEFGKLQGVMMDGVNAINRTQSPKIRFEAVNALRKTVNNTAEELKNSNPNAARILKQFGKEMDEVTEGVLNREAPKLGEKFREANRNWAKYKNDSEFLDDFLPDGVENIVKKTMGNSDNVIRMKELVGENNVKEIGKSYVKDILGDLGKSGVARADSALSKVKKNKAVIIEALGEDTYNNLVDNLYYLNRLNQPLGVSRSSLYSLLFSPQSELSFKKIALNISSSAKSYAEMKGMGAKDAVKEVGKKASKPITVPFKRIIDADPVKQGAIGNLLTDTKQRSGSYFVRGPVARNEEEDARSVAGKKFKRKN